MRKYIGKDYVHEGCGLLLDEEKAWEGIAYASRKNIKKAESAGVQVQKVSGTPEEMEILRKMWYEPNDPNLPAYLREGDHMFIAFDKDSTPIGCCVLLETGNHLFLNNLAGTPSGKELRVQDYLLWHSVKHFSGSKYKYIDVGVSYRKSLYRFFEKWKVVGYPVIFYKPEFAPSITINPFYAAFYSHERNEQKMAVAMKKLEQLTGTKQFTFVPNGTHALNILKGLNHKPQVATFHFPQVGTQPCFVDLPAVFPVQFGTLIFNVNLTDEDLWNKYGCLDFFKRELIFTRLANELDHLDSIIDARKRNWQALHKMFSLEDLYVEPLSEHIPKFFRFQSPMNKRFSEKLNEFAVEHFHDPATTTVGLPIHQNLNQNHMEYVYGIYRGVLNLCSEWVHTDKVASYKNS